MDTSKVWIVLVLLVVILVGSNVLMIAMVRGARGMHFNLFKGVGKEVGNPLNRDGQKLDELNKLVQQIRNNPQDDEKD